jgi:hypothetical protein
MNPKIFDVKPVSILGTTVNKIEISNGAVDLNASVHFDVKVFDESGAPVVSRNIAIDGDDYKSWGSNDDYIVDLILTRLGLERA